MKLKAHKNFPTQLAAPPSMKAQSHSQLDSAGSPPHGEIKQFKPLPV
jgi:hypothetical protein